VQDIVVSKLMLVLKMLVQLALTVGLMFRIGRVCVRSQWVITFNKISLNTSMTYRDLRWGLAVAQSVAGLISDGFIGVFH
jgi:hypothetical protein